MAGLVCTWPPEFCVCDFQLMRWCQDTCSAIKLFWYYTKITYSKKVIDVHREMRFALIPHFLFILVPLFLPHIFSVSLSFTLSLTLFHSFSRSLSLYFTLSFTFSISSHPIDDMQMIKWNTFATFTSSFE